MSLFKIIATLVSREPLSSSRVESLDIRRDVGRDYTWIVIRGQGLDDDFVRAALNALSPAAAGCFVGSGPRTLFYSYDGFPPQHMDGDSPLLNPLVGDEGSPGFLGPILDRDIVPRSIVMIAVPGVSGPLDAHRLEKVLFTETWMGSRLLDPALSARNIQVTVGAQQIAVQPKSARAGDCLAVGEYDGLRIGMFRLQPREKVLPVSLITPRGAMPVREIAISKLLETFQFSGQIAQGFNVQLGFEVELYCEHPLSPESQDRCLQAMRGSPAVATAMTRALTDSISDAYARKNAALERRRSELVDREVVYIRTTAGRREKVGLAPSNEIEVIILATRLATVLAEQLGTFEILEHTAREGIDAIVNIQLAPDMPATNIFLEFEFQLGNFFTHGHPLRQTAAIVCWSLSARDLDRARERGWVVESHADGWSSVMRSQDHMVRVLPLRNMPGLEII